jgi:hypothetical protein
MRYLEESEGVAVDGTVMFKTTSNMMSPSFEQRNSPKSPRISYDSSIDPLDVGRKTKEKKLSYVINKAEIDL